jgi:3-methyladenine DNA glycosylase Mpg
MIASRSRIGTDFFHNNVEYVAEALIGADLFTRTANPCAGRDGLPVGGKIVATESYGHGDVFSHSYDGPGANIKRGALQMCGPPGTIYFAENGQGCTFNISCGPKGCCSAVLICVLLPFCASTEIMRCRRRSHKGYNQKLNNNDGYIRYLCDGPANLCDSLGISKELYTLSHDGKLHIDDSHFELFARDKDYPIEAIPRKGLNKQIKGFKPERAAHPEIEQHRLALRRFVLKGLDKFPSCLRDPE